jgi:hypothetical protein
MSDLFKGAKSPSDLGGEYIHVEDKGPKIRLLYCYNCTTIEELPDFEGRPEDDILLELMIEKHQSAGIPHNGFLSKIGVHIWSQEKFRKEIIKNLRTKVGGGLADIDPEYYSTKATFAEDAMKCYNLHLRPVDGCYDYASDKKKLIPKTQAERKELGLAASTSNIYLCDFCPVKSHVVTQQRKQAGMYKD